MNQCNTLNIFSRSNSGAVIPVFFFPVSFFSMEVEEDVLTKRIVDWVVSLDSHGFH